MSHFRFISAKGHSIQLLPKKSHPQEVTSSINWCLSCSLVPLQRAKRRNRLLLLRLVHFTHPLGHFSSHLSQHGRNVAPPSTRAYLNLIPFLPHLIQKFLKCWTCFHWNRYVNRLADQPEASDEAFDLIFRKLSDPWASLSHQSAVSPT